MMPTPTPQIPYEITISDVGLCVNGEPSALVVDHDAHTILANPTATLHELACAAFEAGQLAERIAHDPFYKLKLSADAEA